MSQEYIWSCVRQHENQPNNPTRSLFVGSSQRQWGGSFTHCATHSGRGRACNMKVFVLGSDLMWWQHILMSNSWPSRCPSCDNPVRPCFHSAFRRSSERHVTCCKNDWFSKVKTRKPVVNFTWDEILFFQNFIFRQPMFACDQLEWVVKWFFLEDFEKLELTPCLLPNLTLSLSVW